MTAWSRLTTSCACVATSRASECSTWDAGEVRAPLAFARRGAKVIGIDHSADQLAYARRLAEEEDLRVELRHDDLADLAFLPPASVDVAFSGSALTLRRRHRPRLPTGASRAEDRRAVRVRGRASRCARLGDRARRTGAATRSAISTAACSAPTSRSTRCSSPKSVVRGTDARADDARHARTQARAVTPTSGSARRGEPTIRRAAASPPLRPARLRRA